jgi:hypothetical protein
MFNIREAFGLRASLAPLFGRAGNSKQKPEGDDRGMMVRGMALVFIPLPIIPLSVPDSIRRHGKNGQMAGRKDDSFGEGRLRLCIESLPSNVDNC